MAIPVGKISAYISIATFVFAVFSSLYVALASFVQTKDDVDFLKSGFSEFSQDRKIRDRSIDGILNNQESRLSRIEGKLDTILGLLRGNE